MAEQYISMKSWAEDDRPREKLVQKGVSALSTNELFAIILRSGAEGESALDLARRMLADCGNDLNILAQLGVWDLVNRYNGVGIAKASAIIAAMEIGRRRKTIAAKLSTVIRSSSDVFYYMSPIVGDLDHEEFWVIYLGGSNNIKGSERLFSGGMSSTIIDVRILFRKALDMKASNLIIVHNHPGGSLNPSIQDEEVTSKIYEAGELIGITLFDHVIIGGDSYFSFVDENLLTRKVRRKSKG